LKPVPTAGVTRIPLFIAFFFLIVKFYRYLQYCYLLQSLISRGRICAFISKKEQAKKEETRRKDGEITRIKYEFVLSQLLVRALAVSIEWWLSRKRSLSTESKEEVMVLGTEVSESASD
jgi:hypothetical protein